MTKREIQQRSGFVLSWDGPFVDGAGRWMRFSPFRFQHVRYNRDRDPGDEDRS